MAEKIEKEPESFDIITGNDINNNTNNETYEDCCEHDYIKSQINNDSNEEEEEDDDDDYYEENNNNNGQETSCNKNNKETLSLSSSSTNFSNDSNNSLANRLKSILKKPRSYSESESSVPLQPQHHQHQESSLRNSFGSSDCNSNSESLNDMTCCTNNKKSVSFNKQVIRNVFKPGSTVNGMKKPNPNKNKKKNKRKRTVSDPSSDVSQHKSEQADLNNTTSSTSNKLRPRNMSESSDDNSSQTNSDILVSEENMSEDNKQYDDETDLRQQQQQQKKKKKNKKKNNKASKQNDENNNTDEAKNLLDLEKMISWKNEGRLNSSDDTTMNVHKTQCSFKFKNKFINVLDDWKKFEIFFFET